MGVRPIRSKIVQLAVRVPEQVPSGERLPGREPEGGANLRHRAETFTPNRLHVNTRAALPGICRQFSWLEDPR